MCLTGLKNEEMSRRNCLLCKSRTSGRSEGRANLSTRLLTSSITSCMRMKVWRRGKGSWRSWGASNGLSKGKRYLSMQRSIRRSSKKLKCRLQKTERPLAKPNWKWRRACRISPTESFRKQSTHGSKCFRRSKSRRKASKARLRRRKTMQSTWKKCTGRKSASRSKGSWSITRDKSSMSLCAEVPTTQAPPTRATLSRRWSNHQTEMGPLSCTTDHGERLMVKALARKEDRFYSEISSLNTPVIYRLPPNTRCRIPPVEPVPKGSAKDLWRGMRHPQQQLWETTCLEVNQQTFALKGSMKICNLLIRITPPFIIITPLNSFKMMGRKSRQTIWPSSAGREKPGVGSKSKG